MMQGTFPLRRATGPATVARQSTHNPLQVWWWGILLFMCTTPFPFVFQHVDPNNLFSVLQEKSLYIYFKIAFMPLVLYRAWNHNWNMRVFFVKNRALGFFVLLAWLSAAWSPSPYLAGRTAFDLTMTLAVCTTLAATFDAAFVIAVVRSFFQIVIVTSIVWIVAVPVQGIHGIGTDVFGEILAGAFRGVYIHKNIFGQCMALSFLFFWLHARGLLDRYVITLDHIFLALSLVLLILARCVSGLVIIAFSTTFIYWLKSNGLVRVFIVGVAAVGIILCLAFTNEISNLAFSVLGKDSTLTGRTQGWTYMLSLISHRWLGGYGFGATGYLAFRMQLTTAVFGAFVDSHNGYLDILFSVGIFGLALFLAWVLPPLVRILVSSDWIGEFTPMKIMAVLMVAWLAAAMVEVSPFNSSSPSAAIGYLAVSFVSLADLRRRPGTAQRQALTMVMRPAGAV